MRRIVLAVALACAVAPLRAQEARAVGGRADLTWRLFTLDGRRTTLEPLRGRVIVVNAWATWCEPCVAELASMAALRAAVPDTMLAFALVAPQRAAPVRTFVQRRAVTLPVYLEAAPAPASFDLQALPTTWIIDRDGCIVARRRGAADWSTETVRAQLRALLAAPPVLERHCDA